MLLLQTSEEKEPGNITYNNCIMKESGRSQCDLTAHARTYYSVSGIPKHVESNIANVTFQSCRFTDLLIHLTEQNYI
jgi:hypothetical protein